MFRRIDYCAASDSETEAPMEIGEFFRQRRRWIPSTVANIWNLLSDQKNIRANNDDISWPYISYQTLIFFGTIMSPGIIFLMITSAMSYVSGSSILVTVSLNLFVILIYIIVCAKVKNIEFVIFLSKVLSISYAILMVAVLINVLTDISKSGFLALNTIVFIMILGSMLFPVIFHPKEIYCIYPVMLYMLLIPCMYYLLPIYAITNMDDVSWGTREAKKKPKKQNVDDTELDPLLNNRAEKKRKNNFLSFIKSFWIESDQEENNNLEGINNSNNLTINRILLGSLLGDYH